MKFSNYKGIAAVIFLLIATIRCDKEEVLNLSDTVLPVTSYTSSDCKGNLRSLETECYVVLKSIDNNKLKVEYINAEMNCCPGEIKAQASIQDKILKIIFYEDPPGDCRCLCNYDLSCVIDSILPGKYETEIYRGGELPDAHFSFTYSQSLELRYNITN